MKNQAEDIEEGMTFLEHLEEFRWTLGRSCLAFIIGVVLVLWFMKDVSVFLQLPLLKAYGSAELLEQNLITYRPMGVISVYIQVAFLGGLSLAMPFILYFLGCFIAPGLTDSERKILAPSCFGALLMFSFGIVFAFFIVLPLTLGFTVRLNEMLGFDLLWAASDYYNLVVWFSLASGLFFQFPLIIIVLIYLNIVPLRLLTSSRAAVFVGLMIFSALVTPGGDFISLPVITGMMYALYELAILVGVRIDKRRVKKEIESMDDLS
ncbi:MAG: twin-arginine translocase subunit TatC [Coraliomargaritaceae bacterium]